MSASIVEVNELISWGLDEYSYRELATPHDEAIFAKKVKDAERRLARREAYSSGSALLADETQRIQHLLNVALERDDLREEYRENTWSLGVVDLRYLLAFQRRLIFDAAQQVQPVPHQQDWPGLIAFSIGSARCIQHHLQRTLSTSGAMELSLHSHNPDLQLRLKRECDCTGALPLYLYGGCPFFEVAELRGRWFLRDGYHRAYRLIRAGVHCVPAVILRPKTIEELGATEPWFFDEQQLFSERPPHVTDFMNDEMSLRYHRQALRKVIRIHIEESLEELDRVEGEEL